jgi:prephenate dehydrogenase
VLGLGLIGGSVALALRAAGWYVSGVDGNPERETDALARRFIDARGTDPLAEVSFVAVPVSQVTEGVRAMLAATGGFVTDVGSVDTRWPVANYKASTVPMPRCSAVRCGC